MLKFEIADIKDEDKRPLGYRRQRGGANVSTMGDYAHNAASGSDLALIAVGKSTSDENSLVWRVRDEFMKAIRHAITGSNICPSIPQVLSFLEEGYALNKLKETYNDTQAYWAGTETHRSVLLKVSVLTTEQRLELAEKLPPQIYTLLSKLYPDIFPSKYFSPYEGTPLQERGKRGPYAPKIKYRVKA